MSRWMSSLAKNTKNRAAKSFFDANLLMEVIHSRDHKREVVELMQCQDGWPQISALTGHLVMYFGGKSGFTMDDLEEFLKDFQMVSLEEQDFAWAFANRRNDDFEDALQVAAAVRSGCEVFYTLDQKLANDYQDLATVKFVLVGGES